MKPTFLLLPALVAGLALSHPATALAANVAATPEQAAAGRALLERNVDAVVGVEMVVVVRMSVRGSTPTPRENKRETNGTVISRDGLTVLALSAISPRAMMNADSNSIRMEDPEFKEVKLRLADNSEIPARVVLQDSDLDLAFIAPDRDAVAGKTFAHIDLNNAVEGQILDTFYEIIRASKAQQRTPLIRMTSVAGLMTKPRKIYLTTDNATSCPSLDAQGRVLGICVRHGSTATGMPPALVVLPAADIAEMAKQAAAKALETPPAVAAPAVPETPATPVEAPAQPAPAAPAPATPEAK